LLPDIKQGTQTYHLLVQGGKGAACSACSGVGLHLLNRDDLSGRGGPGHLGGDVATAQAPGNCEILTAPAVSQHAGQIWVLYANSCGVAGYQLIHSSGRSFALSQRWFVGVGGSTPVLSGGVLYVAHDGEIRGYNPSSGAVVWRAPGIGGVHWEYPLVVGHRLYMTDENGHVTAYSR
jgi:outer membrane protein assembly factor BamB